MLTKAGSENFSEEATDSCADLVTTDINKSQVSKVPQNHYEPSSAGSVIEAEDGFGGTLLIRIQNIASTTNFGCRLDLKKIALKVRDQENLSWLDGSERGF